MGALNSLVQFFGGAPKPQAKTFPTGGFEGATNYTQDRSYIFTSPLDEATNPPAYARTELLSLVRYLANNYAIVERILSLAENYGVGAGILADAATADPVFNEAATKAFDVWASSSIASANADLTFYEIQKLCARELLLAGEVFIVLVQARSGYPQLQLVASENVRGTGKSDDKSLDGLFVDSFGRVNAYRIWSGDTFEVVPSANVVHIKRTKNINQLRGVSPFAASLNSVRDHRDLQNLEKRAIKLHTTLSAVVTKKSGEAGDGVFSNVTKQATVKDGRTVANKGLERAFGGAVVYTQDGEDVKLLASDRSTDGFLSFLEQLLRDVCLNLSLPYEFVVSPANLSGPAIRFVIQDADSVFRNLQNLLIDAALRRIYAYVIACLSKVGKVPKLPKDAYEVSWTRPASLTIDQGRVSSAEIALVQNSLMTFADYFGNRGQDWKSALRQKAQEEAYLNSLAAEFNVGIERLRTLPAGAASVAEPQAQPAEEENQ